MRRQGRSLALSLSLIVFAAGGSRGGAADRLSLTVSGLRSREGLVYASVYSGPMGFPEDPSTVIDVGEAPIEGISATIVFQGLGPGLYAIALFHDENGNKRLDNGILGIPVEGYGFSNDARGFMGPTSFDAAAFTPSGGSLDLFVSIGY